MRPKLRTGRAIGAHKHWSVSYQAVRRNNGEIFIIIINNMQIKTLVITERMDAIDLLFIIIIIFIFNPGWLSFKVKSKCSFQSELIIARSGLQRERKRSLSTNVDADYCRPDLHPYSDCCPPDCHSLKQVCVMCQPRILRSLIPSVFRAPFTSALLQHHLGKMLPHNVQRERRRTHAICENKSFSWWSKMKALYANCIKFNTLRRATSAYSPGGAWKVASPWERKGGKLPPSWKGHHRPP